MIELVERELSRAEIEARKNNLLDLLGERDSAQSTIDEHKREIKEQKIEVARLDARLSQLRDEIRTGKVLEARSLQPDLPGVTLRPLPMKDETDPEYPVQHADAEGNPVADPRELAPEPKARNRRGR